MVAETEARSHTAIVFIASGLLLLFVVFYASGRNDGADLSAGNDERTGTARPAPTENDAVGVRPDPKDVPQGHRNIARIRAPEPRPRMPNDYEKKMLSGIVRRSRGFALLLEEPRLSDADWEALKQLWFKTSAKVTKASRRVHVIGCNLVDNMVAQGRFEQQPAELAKKSPVKPRYANEYVIEQWLTIGGGDVRRTIRIQPGESRELDVARAELRYAEKARKAALGTFLRTRVVREKRR